MSNSNSILISLESKIEKLLYLHRQIKKELSDAQNQNTQLKQIVDQQNQTISCHEEKIKIIKLSKSLLTTNENTTELKLKINELIREVDKGIALLNK